VIFAERLAIRDAAEPDLDPDPGPGPEPDRDPEPALSEDS